MSTATHAQLTAEITSNIPTGDPAVLTAASLRLYLQDQIDSLNVAASATASVNLSTYQPFTNTASVTAASVLLQVYDGAQGVTWGQLSSSAHTISIIAGGSIAATGGISSGSVISATASIASSAGISSGSTVSGSLLSSSGSVVATAGISSGSALSVTGSAVATAGISSGSVMTAQNATATASTVSQAMAMGSAGPGIYWCGSVPSNSSAAQGSLCLSMGGAGPSTRAWVMNSAGTWIGLVAEA